MSDRTGIADTGLIVAYLDDDDQRHAWARTQFERYPFFLTCEAVISESCFLARRQLGSDARVMSLLRVGVLEIGYSARGEARKLADLMARYADQPMSYADACLVRMAERHDRCEVLTVDSDFFVYRRHGNQRIPVAHPRHHLGTWTDQRLASPPGRQICPVSAAKGSVYGWVPVRS